MTKQNNELAQRFEPSHAELILSPAMQAQTVVDRATLEEMVARQVAEMLTKSDTAVFEPFFRNRQVAYALRRLQSIRVATDRTNRIRRYRRDAFPLFP
jgi:hypothetical protein